jgi:hypothetical protein
MDGRIESRARSCAAYNRVAERARARLERLQDIPAIGSETAVRQPASTWKPLDFTGNDIITLVNSLIYLKLSSTRLNERELDLRGHKIPARPQETRN